MDSDHDDSFNFQIKIKNEVEWNTEVKNEIVTTDVQFYDSSLRKMVSIPDTFTPEKEVFKVECDTEFKNEIVTTDVQFYDSSLRKMVSIPDTFTPEKEAFTFTPEKEAFTFTPEKEVFTFIPEKEVFKVECDTKVKNEFVKTEVQFYDSSLRKIPSIPDTFIPEKEAFKECMNKSKYYNELEYKYNPVFDDKLKPQDKSDYLVQPKCQNELLKNNLQRQNCITQHYNNLNPLTTISPALTAKNCEATQISPKKNLKRLLPHGSETLCTAPMHETSSEVRTVPCFILLDRREVLTSKYMTSVFTHPDSSRNNTAPKSIKHRWKSDDICPPKTLVKVKQSYNNVKDSDKLGSSEQVSLSPKRGHLSTVALASDKSVPIKIKIVNILGPTSDDKTVKTTKKDATKLDQKSPYNLQKGKPTITKVNGTQSHGQNNKTLSIPSDINENQGVNPHIVLGLRRSPREYQAAKVNTSSRCEKKSSDCVISHKNSVPKSDVRSRSLNLRCDRRLRARKNKSKILLTEAISYSVLQHEIKTIHSKINFSKYQVESQIINCEPITIIERNHY